MQNTTFSSSTGRENPYEQAFDMFRYRINQLDNLNESKYIVEKIKEISLSPYIDPDRGPFCTVDLSILDPNTSRWIYDINEEAKKYLGVESIDEGIERAKKIRSDCTHFFHEFSHLFEKPEKIAPKESPQSPLRNSAVNLNIPPEKACPLIREKLENPAKELTIEDSINLLSTCIKYGEARAEKVKGKQAIVVIGNTGAGKSTLVNYLYGCEFEIQDPQDIGLRPEQCMSSTILGVKKTSEKPEIMKIGHTNRSETFMPEIVTDDQGFTYCDCPGFLDNRGAEINIANAVNIKNALRQAQGIKVIILINRNSLFAERGRGFTEMIQIACHLFGSRENLVKYKDSILLGVTQLEEITSRKKKEPLELLKKRIVETDMKAFDRATLAELSECLFIYDPLNATNLEYDGVIKRGEIIGKIADLKPIKNSVNIFQTVLGDQDEKKLIFIVEKMEQQIKDSLTKKDFKKAASLARNLKPLEVIGHSFVNNLLVKNAEHTSRYFTGIVSEFKLHCAQEEFDKAQTILQDLENAAQEFGPDLEIENVNNLKELYNGSLNKKKVREEKKRLNEKIVAFKEHCNFERFEQSEKVLKELENATALFTQDSPDLKQFEEELNTHIKLESLQVHYQGCKDRYNQRIEKEKQQAERVYINEKVNKFNQYCTSESFFEAEKILTELAGLKYESINDLQSYYQERVNRQALGKIKKLIDANKKKFHAFSRNGQFTEAENILIELKNISDSPDVKQFEEQLNFQSELKSLQSDYEGYKNRYNQRIEKEKEQDQRVYINEKVNKFNQYCISKNFFEAEKILNELADLKYKDVSALQSQYQGCVDEKKIEMVKKDIDAKKGEFNFCCIYDKAVEAEKILLVLESLPTVFVQQNPTLNHIKQEIIAQIQVEVLRHQHKVCKERSIEKEKQQAKLVDEFNRLCKNEHLELRNFDRRVASNVMIATAKILDELVVLKHENIDKLRSLYCKAFLDFCKNYIEKAKEELDEIDEQLKAFESFPAQLLEGAQKQGSGELTRCISSDEFVQGLKSCIQLDVLRQKYQEIKKSANAFAFGAEKWNKYFGDVGVVPSLPPNIENILNSPCLFWPGKKVCETHLLILVPATVNGKPLTLNFLQELIQNPKEGHKAQYRSYEDDVKNELGNQTTSSHWVLITRDVIPDSRNKTYEDQKKLVATHAQKSGQPYELPTALDAVTCILIEHVQTGTKLYTDDVWCYTRCQEKVHENQWPVAIGGFVATGLGVTTFWGDGEYLGVRGWRRF